MQGSKKPETTKPSAVVDFSLPDECCDFEVDNLPGPEEFEDLHGYSIDDED